MILRTCMIVIGAFSAFVIWKTLRPSPGKPYEQITMEQAQEFMSYESDYILADVGTEEDFAKGHLEGALNIPYNTLGTAASQLLPDAEQQIYVYGRSRKTSEKAARKLCELGYVNITEIGTYDQWKKSGKVEKES